MSSNDSNVDPSPPFIAMVSADGGSNFVACEMYGGDSNYQVWAAPVPPATDPNFIVRFEDGVVFFDGILLRAGASN